MTTISAIPVLGSRNVATDDKVGTLLLRYPKCIHAEFMTHRMFSRNAASSRAIPVARIIQSILDDPYIPLVWGKNQKGMQSSEDCNELIDVADMVVNRETAWQRGMYAMIDLAKSYDKAGYHKQIINRLLEPWAHITVVVTSTNWSNFLALRDDPAAEPHIQILAREMRKALSLMTYNDLQPGEWHLPFVTHPERMEYRHEACLKLSVARCASTSYKTVEGFDMTLETAARIHDGLLSAQPIHASPAEHQCYTGTDTSLYGNFTGGFCQYRKTLPGECQ